MPSLGARYWAAISLASVFGANVGDFSSHVLGLGHAWGLLPLAAIFSLILLAERRAAVGTEAYYWLAIVTLRTAATNLADLATHDLHWPSERVIAALAAFLIAVLIATPNTRPGNGLPATDAPYWIAMLTAGTLGTAAGDFVADTIGLGTSSLGCVALLAAMPALGRRPALRTKPFYWATIVVVRTAGTNVGDFLAGPEGLHLGLVVSTALTGVAMVGTLLLWRPNRRPSQAVVTR